MPVNTRVSTLAYFSGYLHRHTDDSGLFFVLNDEHESAVHPCQHYPIQLFWQMGLACVVLCLQTSSSFPVSSSTPQVLTLWSRGRTGGRSYTLITVHFLLTRSGISDIFHFWKSLSFCLTWKPSSCFLSCFLPDLLSKGVQHVTPALGSTC